MELRAGFEKLELKIVNLAIQPYFKYYLSTLVNSLSLQENISIILEQIRSTLKENDLYLYNHYDLLVENYYSFLNFYEEQVESSSLFASQEVLKTMSLNPELEKTYKIFFQPNHCPQDFPLDIQKESILNDSNEILECKIKLADIEDDEQAFTYLLKVANRLKKIKEKNKEQYLNMELENIFFLMRYQLESIGKRKRNTSKDKLGEILKTINNIQDIFSQLGWIKKSELKLNSSIPSKKINEFGIKDLKDKS